MLIWVEHGQEIQGEATCCSECRLAGVFVPGIVTGNPYALAITAGGSAAVVLLWGRNR